MARLFRYILLLFSLAASSLAVPLQNANNANYPAVQKLYEYSVGMWVENIAVRPSGELLLTLATAPHIDQLNPFDTDPVTSPVATLPNGTSNFRITEIDTDVYAVIHGNFSLTAGTTPGSWSIWTIAFSQPHEPSATAAKVADIPDARLPNGLANLPSASKPENVLAGDIQTGKVYRINTRTGAVDVPIYDNLTEPAPEVVFGEVGVNGLHVKGSNLYFANTGEGILGRLPIHENGDPAGAPSVVMHAPPDIEYDDFALRGDFAYMVTGYGDSIERVSLDGKSRDVIVAGMLNNTTFAEPTSAAFGRTEKDKYILYVVTAGGLAAPVGGNITIGGQVLAVDLSKCGW